MLHVAVGSKVAARTVRPPAEYCHEERVVLTRELKCGTAFQWSSINYFAENDQYLTIGLKLLDDKVLMKD